MSRTLPHLLTLSLFAFGVSLVGCSGDDGAPLGAASDDVSGTETLATLDLDQQFGGLSYTDEDAAFGDDELFVAMQRSELAAMAEDEEDSLADEDPTLHSPAMRHTFLRIVWGQLDGEFDPQLEPTAGGDLVDWSGSISVSDGVVVLKRTILFERPFDHRLARDSRDSLAWVSHTGPHFDGVLVKLVTPIVDGLAQGTVTLRTPQYETTLNVAELDGYESVVDTDDLGNRISIHGQVFDRERCVAGFLNGFWGRGEDRPGTDAIEMGAFRGRVLTQAGRAAGYVMGGFGLDSSGERVMVGKFIGHDGRIRGLMRGTWQPAENGEGVGSFQARWVNRMGRVMGTLQGRYLAHQGDAPGDGYFEGRWQESCAGMR